MTSKLRTHVLHTVIHNVRSYLWQAHSANFAACGRWSLEYSSRYIISRCFDRLTHTNTVELLRFQGAVTGSAAGAVDSEKALKRKQRFGAAVSASSDDIDEKKQKRAERFKLA